MKSSLKETLVFSKSALEIVTDPFIVGDELVHLAKESSKDFLRVLDIDKFQAPFACLNILRGGRYYGLIDAWDDVMIQSRNKDYQLALSEIRAARSCDVNGNWITKVWHDPIVSNISYQESESNLLNARTLIIGDTVATATTLKYVLKWIIDLRKQHNINKKLKVVVYSICGSSVAKYRLYPFYTNVLQQNNVEMELFLANAGYVLNEVNGTDLSLITDDILPESKKFIEKRIGVEFLKHMKCAIWDWGERFNGIQHHLKEIMLHFTTFYIHDLPPHLRVSLLECQSKIVMPKL